MRRARVTYGSVYSFHPDAFVLPTEYTKLVKAYAAAGEQHQHALQQHAAPAPPPAPPTWICKPVDSSRGRHIFLWRSMGDLVYDQPASRSGTWTTHC